VFPKQVHLLVNFSLLSLPSPASAKKPHNNVAAEMTSPECAGKWQLEIIGNK
jgi:hypothetical protein